MARTVNARSDPLANPPILPHVGAVVLLVAMAIGFTVILIHLQAAAGAYISGESQWSRAQLATVHALQSYGRAGDPADLQTARQQLDVALGDMQARIAMDQPVLDRQAVVEGFRRGRIDPAQVPGMIRLYRWFGGIPHFRDAVTAWRRSDAYVLELAEIADELETAWTAGTPSSARIEAIDRRLARIDTRMDGLAGDFRRGLSAGSRWLRHSLTAASLVVLTGLALLAAFIVRRMTAVVARSEHRFRAIFERAGVGIAQLDPDARIVDVNDALCRILRYPRSDLLNRHYLDLVHPDDAAHGASERQELIQGKRERFTVEQRYLRGDGSVAWCRMTASSIAASGGLSQSFISVFEDVSEARQLAADLSYQANHDSLTGLINRHAFELRLLDSLRATSRDGSRHALVFIDLDQFKLVNDQCGHAAGDELLRQVSELFRQQLREGDLLGRLGGDEFALILEQTSLQTAANVAEKLRTAIANSSFAWEEQTFSLGCSMGVVPITHETVDVEAALRAADMACYLAKEEGRNKVYVLTEDDERIARRRGEVEWVETIRAAIEADRLILEAQRIEALNGRPSLRYEILVRLLDGDGNVAAPGAFMPAAERFGTVGQIDGWVVERVCRLLADHPQHLHDLDACHINLSGRSLAQQDFGAIVLAALRHTGVPASKLCFEITEAEAVHNLVQTTRFMQHLSQAGCRFALDDFGAGLSSFGYLRRLPVDFIKIDGAFVREITSDPTHLAMVRAINEIGLTLDKQTMAEYVESDDTLHLLRKMGVHYGQGHAIHRPCRLDDLLAEHRIAEVIGTSHR